MKQTILIFSLALVLLGLLGCAPQEAPDTPKPRDVLTDPIRCTGPAEFKYGGCSILEFTFANEAKFDTTISAFINSNKVYEKNLTSYVTAGGYFGQEFEYKTLDVPNEEFTLEVEESSKGVKETLKINPSEGKYVSVTFWEDKFIIEQTKEEQVRID